MKKLMTIIVLGPFTFNLSPISTSFAKDGDGTTTTTSTTSSSAVARASTTASMAGISPIVIEGVIFATAIVLMAAGISSGIDSADGQVPGNGHGH